MKTTEDLEMILLLLNGLLLPTFCLFCYYVFNVIMELRNFHKQVKKSVYKRKVTSD